LPYELAGMAGRRVPRATTYKLLQRWQQELIYAQGGLE
jgi:hypothetical protein